MSKKRVRDSYYVGANYKKYFNTPHWHELNRKLVDTNPKARCWICHRTNTLLIHHEDYSRLFREKLNRDVFILCFFHHNRLHFQRFLFLFEKKTKLQRKHLRHRRLFLRLMFVLKKGDLLLVPWYIMRYTINR